MITSAQSMRPATFLVRSLLLIAAFVVCAAALPFHVALSSNNKENKKELKAQAEALLAKSQDLSNIEASGSPPFMLNASVHYEFGQKKNAEGEARVFWTAPDHYRQIYAVPGYLYDEVGRDGNAYRQRTNDQMPLLIYELQQTIAAAMHGFALAPKQKPSKAEFMQFGAQTLTCVTLKSDGPAWKECLDAEGDIVTLDDKHPGNSSALDHHYEFTGFTSLGTKRFPQQLIFHGGDGDSITIEVRQLALEKDLPASTFDIPIHSAVEPWCAEPKLTAQPTMPVPPGRTLSGFGGTLNSLYNANASLYCVINAAGHVRAASVLGSLEPITDRELQDWMKSAQYPVMQCGDSGVEYEMEISFTR